MNLHGIEIQKKELARLLGVVPNTVTAMIRQGRLPLIVDEYCRVMGELKATLANSVVDKKRRKR